MLARYVTFQQLFAYNSLSKYGVLLFGLVRGKVYCCFAERKPVEGLQMRNRVRAQIKATGETLAQVSDTFGRVIAGVCGIVKVLRRHEESAGGAVTLLQCRERERVTKRFP